METRGVDSDSVSLRKTRVSVVGSAPERHFSNLRSSAATLARDDPARSDRHSLVRGTGPDLSSCSVRLPTINVTTPMTTMLAANHSS